jgi:hypothetical protein
MTSEATRTAAWVHSPADLTRAEAISLHEDNVAAIGARLAHLAESAAPGAARALAELRQAQADEAEVADLARVHEYPYQLAADPEPEAEL